MSFYRNSACWLAGAYPKIPLAMDDPMFKTVLESFPPKEVLDQVSICSAPKTVNSVLCTAPLWVNALKIVIRWVFWQCRRSDAEI